MDAQVLLLAEEEWGLLGLETLEGTALCVLYPVLPHWFPFADLGNDMEFFLKKCDCW